MHMRKAMLAVWVMGERVEGHMGNGVGEGAPCLHAETLPIDELGEVVAELPLGAVDA